jgi:hypothetical protein
MQAHSVVDATLKPLATLASILAGELFDRSVADRWQRRVESAATGSPDSCASPTQQEQAGGHTHRPPGQ